MPSISPPKGKTYWRSLNDLADKPEFREFVEREFPNQASEWLGGGDSRRTFLKIMGASMALAGLASCRRWPEDKLAPYAHRPANRMDGMPVHYATALERGGMGQGILAISFDGRPIKVDGNPTHPFNQGASDVYLQGSVLNVYDPDRSRGPVTRTKGKRAESTWAAFEAAAKGIAKNGLVVLSEASRSPSVARLRAELIQAGAKWFEYEAVSEDNQRAGVMQYAGRPLRAVPRLDEAAVIVAVDADLFFGEPLSIKYNRDFAAGRKLRDSKNAPTAEMNRLYSVECGFTITGSMADHRRGVKPSEIAGIVSAIGAKLGIGSAAASKELQEFIDKLASDISGLPAGKKAVFVAGHRQPAEVHAAVAAINAKLGAPVDYYGEPEDPRPEQGWTGHAEQLKAFAAAVPGAAVLIIGANPALSAPADLKFAELLGKANVSIHAGTYEDETAQACTWHVPLAHYLEAWGDVRSHDGTISVAQPLIEPIFGARSTIEILATLLGQKADGHEIVQETARQSYMKGGFSEWTWKKALFDGVIANSAWKKESLSRNDVNEGRAFAAVAQTPKGTGFEISLMVGQVHDGRYANNGWLVELPDAMTRVSWENPLVISPKTANEWGVESDDVVVIDGAGAQIEAPVCVLPGHPDGCGSIYMGYGRKKFGSVADGVGSNIFAVRTSKDAHYLTLQPKPNGKQPIVACVQDHHIIDRVGKRQMNLIVPELVVEGTLEQYKRKPALGTRKVVALSIFDEHSYEKGQPWVMAKWGMAIDLTTCTGCSACVTACQAENNVPIVGKQMVYRGREMLWLRIDRYFKFGKDEKTGAIDTDQVQAVHQPVFCMHCENAPCEEVCPVAATTHSREGLNMMTYNRCIGTRYCSNNCPYKVRRFNFFDYNAGTKENLYTPNLLRDDIDELYKMQKNPQVTVRSRGVMEKCTYCVQRIENARIHLLAANRQQADKAKFADGSVITACQQACPTEAIVFGDLNDPDSRVSKLHALAQSYGLLDTDLNTKPRTLFLAKVRNNTAGLDEKLYNERTASEGWFFENSESPAPAGEHG